MVAKKQSKTTERPEQGLASFRQEERGPGGWPTDPNLAFIEARYKLDQAREEAARWRSNHETVVRRLRHLESDGPERRSSRRPAAYRGSPANWRLDISDKHIELYMELLRKPRPISADETRKLIELIDAWRDLEHRKHLALKQFIPDDLEPKRRS